MSRLQYTSNHPHLDAVRLLCILEFCGKAIHQHSLFDEEYDTRVIESQIKLQKIHFWLRYPDHLAAALMYCCKPGGGLFDKSSEIMEIVRSIVSNREPELRLSPMLRYFYGAYEPLDTPFSFLHSRRLAHSHSSSKSRTDYYLTAKGSDAIQKLVKEYPASHWYCERCQLICRFFGKLPGEDVRRRQYLEDSYRQTPHLTYILSISHELPERFRSTFGEEL
jgi:hypothetical protein